MSRKHTGEDGWVYPEDENSSAELGAR